MAKVGRYSYKIESQYGMLEWDGRKDRIKKKRETGHTVAWKPAEENILIRYWYDKEIKSC